MSRVRRDIIQWLQHEQSLAKTRMRDRKAAGAYHRVTVKQDIQINRARPPANAASVSAQGYFNVPTYFQKCRGSKAGPNFRDRVEIFSLRRAAYGRSLISRRNLHPGDIGLTSERTTGFVEHTVPVAEVGTQSDKYPDSRGPHMPAKRCTASCRRSFGWVNANRIYPSPHAPNPTPGVATIPVLSSTSFANVRESFFLPGTRAHT